MLKSTITGLEKALRELKELERLSELDNVMALFDELNSAPLTQSELADRTTRRSDSKNRSKRGKR